MSQPLTDLLQGVAVARHRIGQNTAEPTQAQSEALDQLHRIAHRRTRLRHDLRHAVSTALAAGVALDVIAQALDLGPRALRRELATT